MSTVRTGVRLELANSGSWKDSNSGSESSTWELKVGIQLGKYTVEVRATFSRSANRIGSELT